MTEWNDRIRNNPVWQTLEAFGAVIDSALKREGIDNPSIDSLERLRAVLSHCGKRLASADAYLMEPGTLSKLNAAFTNAKSELEAFVADGSAAHLVAANSNLDGALVALSAIAFPLNTDDLSSLGSAAAHYRGQLYEYLDQASSTNNALQKSSTELIQLLDELTAAVSVEKKKIDGALTEFQAQFNLAQTNHASEFSAAQSQRQVTFAGTASQFEKTFSEAQSDRQTNHAQVLASNQAQFAAAQEERAKLDAEVQTERQAQFAALILDYTQKLTEQHTQFTAHVANSEKQAAEALSELKTAYEKTAKSILDKIDDHRKQVENLVGVIGNLGVTSGYQLVANSARNALYLWQFLTVAALGGLIYVAYVIAFTPPHAGGDFMQSLATRIFLSVAVGVFAAYAASQADKSAITERKNRKLALELEAVGPYIAPLPPEMQNKFRADLGERSFGVPDGDTKKPVEEAQSPATALDVIKSKDFREVLEEIVGRFVKAK